MLLHTIDWWPAQSQGSDAGQEKRDRLGQLFPVAPLDMAARTLIAEQEWPLCRQLYDYILYQQIHGRRLTPAGALGLAVANARLVQHLWPEADRGMLSAGLGAVTEFAIGDRVTRRELQILKGELAHLRDGWTAQAGERAGLAVPTGRQWERSAAIGGARAAIWRSAFLYLELAVSGGKVSEYV